MAGPAPHAALARVTTDVVDAAQVVAVVDTNYFIDHLPLIRTLAETALERGLVVVVPWAVIQELDGLKASRKVTHVPGMCSVEVGTLARSATRFLDSELGRAGSALRCQKRSEFLVSEAENDNKILDCCLFFMAGGLPVAILTKDRNLAVKARANGCATCGEWTGSVPGLVSAVAASVGLRVQEPAGVANSQQRRPLPPPAAAARDDDAMDMDWSGESDCEQDPGSQAAAAPAVQPAFSEATPHTSPGTEPVLIYIDEAPVGVAEREAEIAGVPAHVVSREITQYMRQASQCPLTKLVTSRLAKSGVATYSGRGAGLGHMFSGLPWQSCTTLLTAILYYWDVFQGVFPSGINESIRGVLPWVMHVEHLAHCPQTQKPLPAHLQMEPYKYAVESDNVFENTRIQAAERIAETARLIRLAKRLLAQCALVETEVQENERQWAVQCWMIWLRGNSQALPPPTPR
ncbi:hypothetical protein H4R21_000836 [Coemansia helicoidea]|uniref:Uncharacterized protein n=1 Tax=Coemansia helicoidea TaxID=1286919 RepID=A0ACC1LEB8_9FUNG|nr:hypothetical protein H4R21_000836 [Coemansia helicoidea]